MFKILAGFSAISLSVLLLSKTSRLVEQDFFEQDLALSYSFDGDTVNTTALWLINFFVMFLTFIVVSYFQTKELKIMKITIYAFFLFNTIVLVNAITEYLKRGFGEPRPSAFYLCDYSGYTKAVDSGNYTNYYASTKFGSIGDFSKCGDNDAFMSFPSGHASTSFASMLSSAILLHNSFEFQEHIFNAVYYLVLIISTFISVSRVQDNKHHTYDVSCGAIIGCIITIIMWQCALSMLNKLNLQNQEKLSTQKNNNVGQLSNVVTDTYVEF
jgi:diacylglycerol diphosphate phosphatase/phosphatidate phosphatase